jgi:hypothetical protein
MANPRPPFSFPQAALDARIAAEGLKNDLDLRGRLGPQAGQRTGVKKAYAESELRATELLDGLCDRGLEDAVYVKRVVAADDDDDDDGDEEAGGRWISKADAVPPGHAAVPRAEGEARAKRLENWCGALIAGVEDALGGALAGGRVGEGGGVEGLLCRRLTRHCAEGGGRDEL